MLILQIPKFFKAPSSALSYSHLVNSSWVISSNSTTPTMMPATSKPPSLVRMLHASASHWASPLGRLISIRNTAYLQLTPALSAPSCLHWRPPLFLSGSQIKITSRSTCHQVLKILPSLGSLYDTPLHPHFYCHTSTPHHSPQMTPKAT